LGSRDGIGHVTIRLPGVDFLSVVHSDHASIWHRYEDMAPVGRMDVDTERKKEEGKEKKEGEGKERERESGREKGR